MQKRKLFRKHRFNGENVWSFRPKKGQKKNLDLAKKTAEHKDSDSSKLTCPLWTETIKLNKTGKKAFKSELLEVCKTRTKKSSLHIINSFVVLAAHDMVADAGRATTCRLEFKAPSLQTKVQKMNVFSKTWVLTGKQFEDFTRKKEQKQNSRPFKKNSAEQKDLESVNWTWPS